MEDNNTNELGQFETARLHPMLLLREIKTKLLAIILAVITVMSCTYIFMSLTHQPQYQTKTTFVVSVKNGVFSAYSNLNTTKGLTASLSEILSSDVMKKQIAKEMGVERINGRIETAQIENTNILELRVTAPTPGEAFKITTTLLDNYKPLAEDVLNNVVMDVLEHPVVPTAPCNPLHIKRPVILSGLAAAALFIVIICVAAYLRDTVKSVDEAEEKLDTKALGIIRHEKKYKTLKSKIRHKKTSILITNPTTGFDFVETFRKLRTRIDYAMRKNDYKTLIVTSVLEDEGKSTVATNLALSMRKKHEKVLLIDADLKKPSLHKILDYQHVEYTTINEVLEGSASFEDAMFTDEATGLCLLLGRSGTDKSLDLLSGSEMEELLAKAKEAMDMVIIDTPPMSVASDTGSVAEFADAAVIVVRQDQTPVRMINDMIDELDASNASLLGCVLNNFRATDIDDNFSYGQSRYGYGKYGYGKYGYGKYGYSKYGYSKYGYNKYGYGKYGYGSEKTSRHSSHRKEGN